MTAKISMHAASVFTVAGNVFRKQFVGKRDADETLRSQVWREGVAEILEANLVNLNALAHGFVPSHVQRTSGF